MTIKDIAKKARSVRRFDNSKKIRREELESMVDTAHYAPSARNAQTLKFIIANTKEECESIFPSLCWAGYLPDWHGPKEEERPSAYIVVLHDKTLGAYSAVDAGLWTQCIVLEAAEKDYATCIIAALDKNRLVETLNLDTERFDIVHVVALGSPVETVVIEELQDNEIKYWRDSEGVHHVPKRATKSLILKVVLLLIIMMLAECKVYSQESSQKMLFSGIVLDAETLRPLPDVIMYVGGQIYGADDVGRVLAYANVGDTLRMTHIGYQDVYINVSDTMYNNNIFSVKMSQDTVHIAEIVVKPRPMRLAEKSRFMPLDYKKEDVIARHNFKMSTRIAKTQRPTQWDAQMNQSNAISQYKNQQVNRHMIGQDRMVGVGIGTIMWIVETIKKKRENNGDDDKLVNEAEIEYLLGK